MNSQLDYQNAAQLVLLIISVIVVLAVFVKPIMSASKFVLKGIFYSILITLGNLITTAFGFSVGVNLISGSVCGALGIYGMALNYFAAFLYT